ncbi:hypothetical protein GF376_03875 [Candidatus Peregrinibacteria bacterium]|nr:hypothetical protein [Candidatus Peregrinibacteria bacterium]
MNKDKKGLQNLVKLIGNSALSKQRIDYWLKKINSGNINEEEIFNLINDLEVAQVKINTELYNIKFQYQDVLERKKFLSHQFLKLLKKVEDKQIRWIETEMGILKSKFDDVEKKAMQSVRKHLDKKDKLKINQIRKNL